VRRLILLVLVLSAWLVLAGSAFAAANQDTSPVTPTDAAQPTDAAEQSEPGEPAAPSGPLLVAADAAPLVCNADVNRLQYLEVRGNGFDAWALQRLSGSVVDGLGRPRANWSSVWVSPQGRLTLELNLCADRLRGRPALEPGSYTVQVGPAGGAAIAATSVELANPPEPAADEAMPPNTAPAPEANTGPASTPASAGTATTPAPTNPATAGTSTTPAAANTGTTTGTTAGTATNAAAPARSGLGSLQQPFPLGSGALLADGWQLIVTGVTPDAWDGIHRVFPSTKSPASDQRAFMIRIEATFRGEGSGLFTAGRLALLSTSGEIYEQIHDACGIIPDVPPPNLVGSGGVSRGNVCFTVRASDVDALVLFDTLASPAERQYLALN
jgi:hypothetical protein